MDVQKASLAGIGMLAPLSRGGFKGGPQLVPQLFVLFGFQFFLELIVSLMRLGEKMLGLSDTLVLPIQNYYLFGPICSWNGLGHSICFVSMDEEVLSGVLRFFPGTRRLLRHASPVFPIFFFHENLVYVLESITTLKSLSSWISPSLLARLGTKQQPCSNHMEAKLDQLRVHLPSHGPRVGIIVK